MLEYMNLLGIAVEDKVTGFSGVVTTISYDLYGCVQAVVTPKHKSEEKDSYSGRWFDTKTSIVKSDKPVMEVPTFYTGSIPGGDDKSLPPEGPR